MRKYGKKLSALLLLGLLAVAGCAKQGAEPIAFGKDNCANCGMVTSDQQFGAELVSKKGKIFKFDSVECLADYVNKNGAKGGSLWVVDFNHPTKLIEATGASYLQCDKIHSPMGLNLSGFSEKKTPEDLKEHNGGSILTWTGVLDYVRQKRS